MTQDRFAAAVAAQVLAGSEGRRELLQSIVDVACAIFLSPATSIAMLDEDAGELVFEAVGGFGRDELVGARFAAEAGIAGSVAASGEPLIIDDVSGDPRFARDVATETGYMPTAIMAAPLLRGERTLGVLSVLDRGETGRSSLQELQLLIAFAGQAAVALEVGEAARRAALLLAESEDAEVAAIAVLARRLERLEGPRRAAADRLLQALADLV